MNFAQTNEACVSRSQKSQVDWKIDPKPDRMVFRFALEVFGHFWDFFKTTEITISSYFLSKVQKCPENEHIRNIRNIRNIQTNQISLNWDLRSGSNGCRFDWIFRCDFSCEDFLADSAWSGALDFKKYGFTVMLSVQANQKCRRSSFTSLSDRHCLIYLFRYNRRPYNTQLFHRYLGMRVLKWCQLDWFPFIFTKHNNKWSSDNFFFFLLSKIMRSINIV